MRDGGVMDLLHADFMGWRNGVGAEGMLGR